MYRQENLVRRKNRQEDNITVWYMMRHAKKVNRTYADIVGQIQHPHRLIWGLHCPLIVNENIL